jgi:ribosomal protein S18 acetylase RimI-like enzyme
LKFIKLEKDKNSIKSMSNMATEIVREHFDPLVGKAQNDYMLAMFQTPEAISRQLDAGYQYYFVEKDQQIIGFLAFYEDGNAIHISKFYLYKQFRRCGYAWDMLKFIKAKSHELGFNCLELNVNKDNSAIKAYESMGFECIRAEVNDIGEGYVMDDYVYQLIL